MLFIVGAQFLAIHLFANFGFRHMFAWLVLTASYRLKRFTGFLEPFKDPYWNRIPAD